MASLILSEHNISAGAARGRPNAKPRHKRYVLIGFNSAFDCDDLEQFCPGSITVLWVVGPMGLGIKSLQG